MARPIQPSDEGFDYRQIGFQYALCHMSMICVPASNHQKWTSPSLQT
jgi:hypothetical protein